MSKFWTLLTKATRILAAIEGLKASKPETIAILKTTPAWVYIEELRTIFKNT